MSSYEALHLADKRGCCLCTSLAGAGCWGVQTCRNVSERRINLLRKAMRGRFFKPALPAVLVENSDACKVNTCSPESPGIAKLEQVDRASQPCWL